MRLACTPQARRFASGRYARQWEVRLINHARSSRLLQPSMRRCRTGTSPAGAIGGDDAGRLMRQQARQDHQRRWGQMPRHRRRQLPERIGENVRQHQIERRPIARIAARKIRWRESPAPDVRSAFSRAFSRATSTESGSISLASTLSCSALAAAIASTPVPVPRSSTRRGRQAFSTWSSSSRQPRVVP